MSSSSGRESVGISGSLYDKLKNVQSYTALFHIQQRGHRSGGGGGGGSESSEWYWGHSAYVKLPLSSSYVKNEIGNDGVQVSRPRWDVIRLELTKLKSLCEPGQSQQSTATKVKERMQQAIEEYNARQARKCNFDVLDDPELADRLAKSLPAIVEHALKLEYRLKSAIPILKRGRCHTLYLTRNLACSLLANAFLCTFPDQSPKANLPDFNFIKLFHDHHGLPEKARLKREKLKCILQYFTQMDDSRRGGLVENNIISYERRHIPNNQINWKESKAKLCEVLLVPGGGGIEQAEGHLQVDFANKNVGGGVLDEGGVMEEIRFSISPELIVARLFTETLGDDEVLVVTGTRQFSSYSGYSSTFRFEPLVERRQVPVPVDDLGREFTQVVAMDALHFRLSEKWKQYTRASIDRELHKCVVGFFHGRRRVSPIATGNWGCGAFNGDPQLKFLIQWMAASQVGRKMMYFHTSSDSQAREIQEVVEAMVKEGLTVGRVTKIFNKYEKDLTSLSPGNPSIFERVKEYCNKFRFF